MAQPSTEALEAPRRRAHDRHGARPQPAGGAPVAESRKRSRRQRPPSAGHRWLWVFCGVMGLAALAFVHLTRGPHHLLTFHANADKIEHVFAFGAAMLWFGQLYRRGVERVLFCVILIQAGVVLEYVQQARGHYFPVEYGDMAADAVGACLGLLLLRTRAARIIEGMDRLLNGILAKPQAGVGRR